jgi:hypothetical protein
MTDVNPKFAAKDAPCPHCKAKAQLLSPFKNATDRDAVYGCGTCGFSFRSDGGAFVSNVGELQEIFRGATLGNKTLVDVLKGEVLNPATKAFLVARIMEYGLQMWQDGLKQGILLGVLQVETGEKKDG